MSCAADPIGDQTAYPPLNEPLKTETGRLSSIALFSWNRWNRTDPATGSVRGSLAILLSQAYVNLKRTATVVLLCTVGLQQRFWFRFRRRRTGVVMSPFALHARAIETLRIISIHNTSARTTSDFLWIVGSLRQEDTDCVPPKEWYDCLAKYQSKRCET